MNHRVQNPRRYPTRRDVSILTAGSIALVLVLLALVVTAALAAVQPSPVARYLSGMTYLPGRGLDVVAAGYRVCGQMERGEPVDSVVRRATVYGIGGDLYTSGEALAVVEAARRDLCPA